MKNITHFLPCFILLTCLIAESEKTVIGTITGSHVNIRAHALGTAEICCQLVKGDKVEVLERRSVLTLGTNTEEWVRIVLPEKANVWVESSFIYENKITESNVNGRAGPSLMWPILCKFSKGETVNVRTNYQNWAGLVPPHHASAWVFGKYVHSETVDIPTAPVAKPE